MSVYDLQYCKSGTNFYPILRVFELSGTSTEREDQWSPDRHRMVQSWPVSPRQKQMFMWSPEIHRMVPSWPVSLGTNRCRMERVNTLQGRYSPPAMNNADTRLFILHVNTEAASDVQISQRRIKSLCTEFTGLQGWEAWSELNSIINCYNMIFPFFSSIYTYIWYIILINHFSCHNLTKILWSVFLKFQKSRK